jgi:hypothetical protein
MLALTEPNEVHALAVLEPMVDWTGLDEVVERLGEIERSSSTSGKRQKQKSSMRYGVDNQCVIAAGEKLIKLRSTLFPTPSSYFDPFASPLLFLRAPGRDTPLGNNVGEQLVSEMDLFRAGDGGYGDYDSPGSYDEDDDWRRARRPSHASTPTSAASLSTSPSSRSSLPSDSQVTSGDAAEAGFVSDLPTSTTSTSREHQPRRRKVLRRWPSIGRPETVLLPYVKVIVQTPTPPSPDNANLSVDSGHAALMRAQGIELAELLRRACFFGRESGLATERVQLLEKPANADDGGGDNDAIGPMHEAATEWIEEMFGTD